MPQANEYGTAWSEEYIFASFIITLRNSSFDHNKILTYWHRRGFFSSRPWSYRGQGRGQGGRGGRGRGRGQGRGGQSYSRRPSTIATKSAADLDAELETYHSDAMQT